MSFNRRIVSAAGLLGLTLASPATSTVTRLFGQLDMDAASTFNKHGHGRFPDRQHVNWFPGQPDKTLFGNADSKKRDPLKVTNESTITVSAAQASNGSIHVTSDRKIAPRPNKGTTVADLKPAKASYAADWSYGFSVDTRTTLTFTYDLTGDDVINGDGFWQFDATRTTNHASDQLLRWNSDLNPGSSGVLTFTLDPGHYLFDLLVTGENQNRLKTRYASGIDGLFTWNLRDATMSAVPETNTWALMLGGFGLIGGAMRSSRRIRGSPFVNSEVA
jgi:hypothetical protein